MQTHSLFCCTRWASFVILFLSVAAVRAQEPFNANWQVKIAVKNGNSNTTLYFGTHPNATTGFDVGIDQVAPPPGFGFYAAFNISGFPGWLASDIRSGADTSHTWTLSLSNAGATTSTICWEATSFFVDGVPRGRLILNGTNMLADTCLQVIGDRNLSLVFVKSQISSVHDAFATNPKEYGLSESYPNPFKIGANQDHAATVIKFQAPVATQITLNLYNLLGRKIRTLIDHKVAAGAHEIEWDGRDEAGRFVPPGVYLYLLQAGAHTASRKLMLLK